MQGEDIKRWQQRMRDRGWKDKNGDMLRVDRAYGVLTVDVCRKFQAQKGLPATGEVARADWTAAWTAPVTPDLNCRATWYDPRAPARMRWR